MSHLSVAAGRFQVLKKLGSGGFKTVWKAYDKARHIEAALSVFHDTEDFRTQQELFQREAQILANLTRGLPPDLHKYRPRLIELLDYGKLSDAPPFDGLYLATRFLPGQTLSSLMKEQSILPLDRAIHIAQGILEALEVSHTPTIHRGSVLHRDIKPANILIDPNDDVTVIDFGISKIIECSAPQQSAVMGTLSYMAPEQLDAGADIGPQTDLFSVGVILHELVTGHPPWPRNTMREVVGLLLRAAHEEPPLTHLDATELPKELKTILRSALAIDLYRRPESARVMHQALAACRGALPSPPRSADPNPWAKLEGPEIHSQPRCEKPKEAGPTPLIVRPDQPPRARPLATREYSAAPPREAPALWSEIDRSSIDTDVSDPPMPSAVDRKVIEIKPMRVVGTVLLSVLIAGVVVFAAVRPKPESALPVLKWQDIE